AGIGTSSQSSESADGRHHRGDRRLCRAFRFAHRAGAEFRARLGPRRAAGGALLCRHQPLDRERLCRGLSAQSASRRNLDRAANSRGLADRAAEPADRRPGRQGAGAGRAHAPRARRNGSGQHVGRGPPVPHRSRLMSVSHGISEKVLTPIEIGLTAAIVAIEGNEPLILTASSGDSDKRAGLPFGPFDAVSERTFEIGLRAWVEEQAGLRLGYVEQLYTFGDRGRHTQAGDTGAHVASIGYLALTRAADNAAPAPGATFEQIG